MSVNIEKFAVSSKGFDDFIDITSKVIGIVSSLNLNNALVNIAVVSSCSSVAILDSEQNLALDLSNSLDSIVPLNKAYKFDETWHEGNAHAHLKASILGNSISIPVNSGKIELQNYQKIVLIDFDNKTSTKEVIISVIS